MLNAFGVPMQFTVPPKFYVDMNKFSEQETQLLSAWSKTPMNDMKQNKILFERLITINPTYALYHNSYANTLTYFSDKAMELHHRRLANQYNPYNTEFIKDYIDYLYGPLHGSFNIPESSRKQILCLFKKLIARIALYQSVLCHQQKSPIIYDSNNTPIDHPNLFSIFGYLSEFPFLSYLYACNNMRNNGFLQNTSIDISLNRFISQCYDDYYSFQCVCNHQHCDYNQAFKFGESSIQLAPDNWNKKWGLLAMYSLKGRYLKSLQHINSILNIFEANNISKKHEIIKSMHPMKINPVYLFYLRMLIRLEKFELALQRYQYCIDHKLIDEQDKIWFVALTIELFAHLSVYNKTKSSKYIKKALMLYNTNKQLAMFDHDNVDLFYVNYGFLLIVSGKKQSAMDVLERRILTSRNETGWIEFTNAYLQHYKFKNYKHAKHHYFASMIHNNQIPEVRYHLAVLMMLLKEYKLSYLQLKKAINIQSGLPIINKNGNKLLRKLRKKLKELKCAMCSRCYYPKSKNRKRLSVCKGCGSYYYCNKKCQKKHWNTVHRLQCSKGYESIFKMLKTNAKPKCNYYKY